MTNRELPTNFPDLEIACKCGCGTLPKASAIISLQALRQKMGRALIVYSGARCEKHNKAEGGAPESRHVSGEAFDVECNDSRLRVQIIRNAIAVGFNGIGIAKSFVHIDLRPAAEEVCWIY